MRVLVAWMVLALLATACSGSSAPVEGSSDGEPGAVTTTGVQVPDSTEAPSTSVEPTRTSTAPPAFDGPIRIALPIVPPIVLPDLSLLDDTGAELEDNLGDALSAADGLDVVSADCVAAGGELTYQGSNASSFFELDADGSGEVVETGDSFVRVVVDPDGSGEYVRSGDGEELRIEVDSDGSGTYVRSGADQAVTIEVEADGSGTYVSTTPDESLTVELGDDGAGRYDHVLTTGPVVSIEAKTDGSGRYVRVGADSTDAVSIEVDPQGSWRYTTTSPEVITLEVQTDGSGSFSRVDDSGTVLLSVDTDGNGIRTSPTGEVLTYTTDVGLLDPDYFIVSPSPTFVVADSFPPLDRLAPIDPPCLTVIRLGADLLFDFDSADLRPEAAPVLEALATTLADQPDVDLEVAGHTDAIGDEAYNQGLSEQRAAAVAAALRDLGVSTIRVVVGFGELVPAASNTTADGADNPVGRQLNRRVEIVVRDR